MAEPRPITAKQQEVLELMRNGWELACYRSFNGCGTWSLTTRGSSGELLSQAVNANTARGLDARHLIEVKERTRTVTTYKITESK